MNLLGNEVELDVPRLSYQHDERFLLVIGVEELRHVAAAPTGPLGVPQHLDVRLEPSVNNISRRRSIHRTD
jgi:hypothetical protein